MLTFSQVSKSFEGRLVLRDVTLSVGQRSRTAIIGVNGSGKSTLLRLAARLIDPDAGCVRAAPGTTIVYVPQDYLPFGDQTVAISQTARGPASA